MWKIPILNQCCCGCSLKKGSIIIGVLGIWMIFHPTVLSTSFQYTLWTECCFEYSSVLGDVCIFIIKVHGIATITETVLQCDSCLTTYKFNTGESTTLELVPVAEVIHGCVLTLFGAALLLGSAMEVPHVVRGWLVARALLSLLTVLLVPLSIGFRVAAKDASAPILLAAGVVEIALDVYFLLVVYSFYRQIVSKDPQLTDF